MYFRHFATACIAAFCLLLVSCIDGHEEIWLNADGSGRAEINYDIPASAARFHGGEAGVRELVDSLLKDLPDAGSEIVSENNRLKVRVNLAFKSASELTSMTKSVEGKKTPAAFEYLAGRFELKRSLNTLDFTRTISPGKALPAAFIPAAQLRDRKLTYILHLPVAADESNATKISDGGKTLTWEQPLAAAMREPIVVHFKATVPLPSWIIGTAIGSLFLIVTAAWLIFSRFKKNNVKRTT